MLIQSSCPPSWLIHPTEPTGRSVCLAYKDKRCCLANIGASSKFNKSFLQDNTSRIVSLQPQVFYIEGYFITADRFSICQTIFESMCKPNAKALFACNLSSSYVINDFPTEMKYFAENSDILIGNASEFEKLREIYDFPESVGTITHFMDFHARKNAGKWKIIILTRGADGVSYYCQEPGGERFTDEYPVERIAQELIVDTTGCGDAFVAGFFTELNPKCIQRQTLRECIGRGAETALRKLRFAGGNLTN